MGNPICRCGFDGTGAHLCHRCAKRPGDRCLREQETPYSLAGMQPKFSGVETRACPECFAKFKKLGGKIVLFPEKAEV